MKSEVARCKKSFN